MQENADDADLAGQNGFFADMQIEQTDANFTFATGRMVLVTNPVNLSNLLNLSLSKESALSPQSVPSAVTVLHYD